MNEDMTQISKTRGKRCESGCISFPEGDRIAGESINSNTGKTLVDRGGETL